MILEGVRPARLLLDTCAVIYLFNGDVMLADAVEAIDNAGAILVSPVSAWEIGILGQKRLSSTPEFSPDPAAWFRAVLTSPKIVETRFDAEVALASCALPAPLHRDPADRFLIATARRLAVPLVTRDKLILGYAKSDHVDAIAC